MLRALWIPARIFLFLLVLFVVWQVWVFSRPQPRAYSADERAALEAVLREALGPVRAGIGGEPSRFGVAHFLNDPNEEATRMMRALIGRERAWTVVEGSLIQAFLSGIGATVLQATSLDEVMHAARRVEIDVVVTGKVVRVATTPSGAVAAVQVHVYDARSAETLVASLHEKEWTPGAVERGARALRAMHPLARLGIWLAVVLALPWVTAGATHRTVSMKRNWASFALLLGYVILGMTLALALSHFQISGVRGSLALLAALVFCGGYSFWACERIAARG